MLRSVNWKWEGSSLPNASNSLFSLEKLDVSIHGWISSVLRINLCKLSGALSATMKTEIVSNTSELCSVRELCKR